MIPRNTVIALFRGSRSVWRWSAAIALLLAFATPSFAQVQGYPVEPEEEVFSSPIPRSTSLQPLPPPQFDPPPIMGQPYPPLPDVGAPFPSPGGCGIPAPKQPCDDPFRFRTKAGGAVTGLPRTLLWEPPLAGFTEPRFQVMPTTLSNSVTKDTLDTSIGNTLGLFRIEPASWKTAVQVDVFAVVYSRFSNYDKLVDADYRFGFPITISRGPWHGKIGYEHTSSHLGDEIETSLGIAPINFIKDELVLGVGRYFFDARGRVYGQVAWAARQLIPGDPAPFRFDVGTEWVGRRATGCRGQPFGALNVRFDGAVKYNPNLSVQGGWMWRDPTRRLAECRIFGEYYTGHSPYGQFFRTTESWFGLGTAFDY